MREQRDIFLEMDIEPGGGALLLEMRCLAAPFLVYLSIRQCGTLFCDVFAKGDSAREEQCPALLGHDPKSLPRHPASD